MRKNSEDAEEYRRRTIHLKLGRMAEPTPAVIATGLRSLDAALGVGGAPRGRISEIFGPPSCGKSTLGLQIVARAQKDGLTAAWIDADSTFDAGRAASLGVSLERLTVAQPASAEESLEIARRLADCGVVDLLVIDSVAALAPRLELSTQLGESGPGLHARVLASGLRRLSTAAARSGMAVLCLNQTRSAPESDAEESSAGGPGLKLVAAVRIALRPIDERRSVALRILKNKLAAPFATCELAWSDEAGFTESP
jgi:recombination protein RecA